MTKNLLRFFSVTLLLAGAMLSSCKKIETPNGELPNEAMAYADQVVGVYQNPTDLSEIDVRINGKRLTATFFSKNNLDVLNSECRSQIQTLKEIHPSSDGKIIRGIFDFNRNYCAATLAGKTIELQIRESKNTITQQMERVMTLNYVLDLREEKKCTYDYPINKPPQQVCTIETTPVYFKKSFVRR